MSSQGARLSGACGPARMPKEIADKLGTEIAKLTRSGEIRSRLVAAGAEPVGSTSDEFAAFIASECAKWSRVIKAGAIGAR